MLHHTLPGILSPSSTLLFQELCSRTVALLLVATCFLVVSVGELGFSIKHILENNKTTA